MERHRAFYVLAKKGGIIEHLTGEPEEALRKRIGNRMVIGRYTTTICNDCDENSCTQGPGWPALEMRNVFTIERMCNSVASGKWRLESGDRSFHYALSFQTKEELVQFLDEMPDSWHGNILEARWNLAVSSARQILNVPRLRIVKKTAFLVRSYRSALPDKPLKRRLFLTRTLKGILHPFQDAPLSPAKTQKEGLSPAHRRQEDRATKGKARSAEDGRGKHESQGKECSHEAGQEVRLSDPVTRPPQRPFVYDATADSHE